MSAYDDEDPTASEEEYEELPAGFEVVDNPDDPEVDLDGTDIADFAFGDEDDGFAPSEEDAGDSF